MHPITVVNKHHPDSSYPQGKTFYIGRGSALGNPYYMNNQHMRDEVCDNYREYIKEHVLAGDKRILDALSEIAKAACYQPVNLQCFCAPKRCHGDTIKEIVEGRFIYAP